jgi:hypothetical protein
MLSMSSIAESHDQPWSITLVMGLEALLRQLCVELGFCLPAAEEARLAEHPPDDVDAFADAIFVAEGMDPRLANKRLWNQVRDRIVAHFGNVARSAHQHASNHREEIEASARCGCFNCVTVFAPGEIGEWVDEGKTALCPYCGIDSVIGTSSGVPMTIGFLRCMRNEWFHK